MKIRKAPFLFACIALFLSQYLSHRDGSDMSRTFAAPPRVTEGLVAYYPFTEGGGTVIGDQSTFGIPMDLAITGSVDWLAGENGVIMKGGKIGTAGSGTKVIDALRGTNQSTFEIWFSPATLTQGGPARMISIGSDTSNQNVVLGQSGADVEVRLLHTGKDAKARPRLTTGDGILTTGLTHMVHTFDGSRERLYVDGVEHPVTVLSGGTYGNWDSSDGFTIGNEFTLDRPWEGTIRLVALYDRALSQVEIEQNFQAGPGGAGNTPPVANDDSYSVVEGTILTVGPAGGVLANDTDADGDLLTAVWASNPDSGTLTLNIDGSFTYTPFFGFTGNDHFTYQAQDVPGNFDIASVTVAVVVKPHVFTDVTAGSNTGGPDWFGGHGAQFADVTGDGLVDFYVTMNNEQAMGELFYRSVDGLTFAEEANLRGIENFDPGSHGGVWADLDNDGDYDLFNGSYIQNRIYRNDGNGFFTDVTGLSGLPARDWPTRGVVASDMDMDGDLDLFAISGWLGSGDPATERNELYRNDGSMQFTAIDSNTLFSAPAGQGATDTDFDGDGDIDIIAANRSGDVNILRNDGQGNFEMVSPSLLGISHTAGDGITLADVNNDGHLDILLAGAGEKHLYIYDGINSYTFLRSFTAPGFMGGFQDLDNDGDWDLVFPGDDKVFFNDGAGNFATSSQFSTGPINDPRSVAFADIDNDGDVDFFYTQRGTYNRLIRNDYDGTNRWIRIRLASATGQAGVFGAKVYIFEPGNLGIDSARIAWNEVRSQEGYLAQNDPALHFGVGNHDAVDVRVVYPGGTILDRADVPVAQDLTLAEPGSPANEPPLSLDDSYSVAEGTILTVGPAGGVLANDTDADGDPLTVIPVSSPLNGTLTLNIDGGFTYAPLSGFTGTDSFTYQANDGTVSGNTARATIGVTPTIPANEPPLSLDDSYSVAEGTTLTVGPAGGVLANDTDADGDPLTAILAGSPTQGTLTLNIDGGFTYAPLSGFTGTDSFTYRANDGTGDGNEAAVAITVIPAGSRVTEGLVVYYPFTEGGGTVIGDRSTFGIPMDLAITGSVDWLAGENGVIMKGGKIGTAGSGTKVIDALRGTNQSTFEIWFSPATLTQGGPARMISIGSDTSNQNVVLGQSGADVEVRLLHTGKDAKARPRLTTGDGILTTGLTHMVHTFDGSRERLYVDGVEHPVTVLSGGTYGNWDSSDGFTIGNEFTLDRPWEGTIRLVALYDRALSQVEIEQNFQAGPGGAGSTLSAPTGQEPIVTPLWYPFAEWTFTGITWNGNPFDVEARALFSDGKTPFLFYDGGSTWKLRYMCTKAGDYTFVTESSLPGLNGLTGEVHCQDNPGGFGSLTAGGTNGKKFYVKGWNKAIVPAWCMMPDFHDVTDAIIDSWIANNLERTGFRGAHLSGPANRWYDIHCDGTRSNCTSENPDPRTFRKLEEIMDKLYRKGAFLHLWMFWDCESDKCDKFHDDPRQERLRNYLADRWGAIPNWMLGEGFDNQEDDGPAYATKWFNDISLRLAWPHFLGMRSFKESYELICTECNYYSWENVSMTFDKFKASYDITTDRPSFEEDRFRRRNNPIYASKDLQNVDSQGRHLWWQAMSGGVGAIYGYLLGSPDHYSLPEGYPEDWHVTIKAWHDFWYGPPHRFLPDMERCDGISDGAALCSPGRAYVFYKESTGAVTYDLTGMSGSYPAMAIDTATGAVTDLGVISPSASSFTFPYVADWAIAVGDFSGSQ